MAETKRRGFHALEDRIHEIEEADRKVMAEEDLDEKLEEMEVAAAEIKPPPAHEE